ncbi:MAG TPA: carboxypeptidase-like regulatory domain-containing protein [Bryobacteraceae bacterium]|nr:carboxypeptidase-like regulatory domain-containing protein [Bryobacteraceae bacterium]
MNPRFAILNPCHKRWTDLSGDGRKRFCDECQTNVHALDQYSLEEFAELKRKSGRVCGFLAGESLPEPRSRRAILIGAFLTAISPLMAQPGRVRIRVTDASGAVIPGAVASLLGEDGKPTRTAYANEAGEIEFSDLPMGNSRFVVQRPGFKNLPLTVTLRNTDEVKVQAQLEGAFFVGEIVTRRPKRHWWQIFR